MFACILENGSTHPHFLGQIKQLEHTWNTLKTQAMTITCSFFVNLAISKHIMTSSESRCPQPPHLVYILEFGMPKTPSTYLTIQQFKPANTLYDSFAKYPIVHAKLWDSSLAKVEIITTSKVLPASYTVGKALLQCCLITFICEFIFHLE